MEFVYKSKVIDDPEVNLIKHLRDTVLNLEGTNDTRDFIIIMGKPLYSILDSEMRPIYPKVFRGIEYLEYNDEDLEAGTYCIYRKDDNIKMKLVWKSYVINDPAIYLISDLRNTIRNFYMTECADEYIIRLSGALYNILDNEIYPPHHPKTFKGIKYIEDNTIEDGCYCIYRKEALRKNEPVLALTPVKTLNEWFANLPLIQKREHYDSHIKIIANNLK